MTAVVKTTYAPGKQSKRIVRKRNHGGTITQAVRKSNTEDAAMMMSVAAQYIDKQNRAMEHTATVVTILTGYLLQRMEDLDGVLDRNTPFSMKLKNRTNHVVKACEEFMGAFEKDIDTELKREAYIDITDIVFPSLNSLFDTLVVGEKEPTTQIIRRAKLRYHDPYKAMVRERQESFEDGYCKGYGDCVRDVFRELKHIEDTGDTEAVINIVDGKMTINRKNPEP